MSIATVVTRGYGSFGSVNKLPTRGYSIGEAIVIASADSVVFIEFRDKRLYSLFRDKRIYAKLRDKRLKSGGHE